MPVCPNCGHQTYFVICDNCGDKRCNVAGSNAGRKCCGSGGGDGLGSGHVGGNCKSCRKGKYRKP